MRTPNFTAEASLDLTSERYGAMPLANGSTDPIVVPAACDSDCLDFCTPGCLELVGGAKGACLRLCHRSCGCRWPGR
jgi:hypothetical protein